MITISKYKGSSDKRITATFNEVQSTLFSVVIYGLDASVDFIDAPNSYIYFTYSNSPLQNIGVIKITKSSLNMLTIVHGYKVYIKDCTIRELEARDFQFFTSTSNSGSVTIANSELKQITILDGYKVYVENCTIFKMETNDLRLISLSTVVDGYQVHVENCTIYELEAKYAILYLITSILDQINTVNSTVRIHNHVVDNADSGPRIRLNSGSRLLISNSSFRYALIQAERSNVVMRDSSFSVLPSSPLLHMRLGNSLRVENCTFNIDHNDVVACILCITNTTNVTIEDSSFVVGGDRENPEGIIKFSHGSSISLIKCLFQGQGAHIRFSDGDFLLSTILCQFINGDYNLYSGMYHFLYRAWKARFITRLWRKTKICHTDAHSERQHLCFQSGKEIQSHTEKAPTVKIWVYVIICAVIAGNIFLGIPGCIYCRKKRKDEKRKKDYDALLFYDQMSDRVFALKMLRELEEKYKLKLCDPPRDFRTAFQTSWNVKNAIKTSYNGLIVISSPEFFNSERCQNALEQCRNENKKDPTFKLVVILAESKHLTSTLKKQIQIFPKKQIYLEKNDSNLCGKIYENFNMKKARKSKRGQKFSNSASTTSFIDPDQRKIEVTDNDSNDDGTPQDRTTNSHVRWWNICFR